ncbi:MAG: alpha/beta fold hydrolase [Alteromonadaceae bacterium]|nr:alpha/beta fold hydrolase [Alteromonadaceae bacterium]
MKRLVWFLVPLFVLISALVIDSRSTGLFILSTALKVVDARPVEKNIAYGESAWQKLDVYPQPQIADVIVFVHGGGWHSGNNDQYYFVADAFYQLGYTVVVLDYHKYPNGRFPQFVQDVAAALAWVNANITSYNGDTNRVFLSGHSAGAHSAALVVSDQRYLKAHGLAPSIIRAFARIAGPYQFTPKWPQYIGAFGKENFERMKAGNHIDGDEPSTLLLHASGDSAVGPFNYQKLHSIMKRAGVPVEGLLYGDDFNHISIAIKLHPWFTGEVNVGRDVDAFFRRQR